MSKFLYQPVFPFSINQAFGEDMACIDKATKTKVVYKQTHETCPVGYRSLYSLTNGHNGSDLQAKKWQCIYSGIKGVVDEVSTELERGMGVGIISDDKFQCLHCGRLHNFKVRYWHMIAPDVQVGDKVNIGSFVGYADSTGFSSGDHVHEELKPVEKGGKDAWYNIHQDNGALGAVDPELYRVNQYALTALGKKAAWAYLGEQAAKIADRIADLLRNK